LKVLDATNQAIEALLKAGLKSFRLDSYTDSSAYFESAICEFGSSATINKKLINARNKALLNTDSSKRNLIPYEWPVNLELADDAVCGLCGTMMYIHEQCYGKKWVRCLECNLLKYFPSESELLQLNQGEPEGAKFPASSLVHLRESFFCNLFIDELDWNSVLLYGAGWSLVPKWLTDKGIYAVGCDLWQPLIDERRAAWGNKSYFHRDELPSISFQLISAFEVFEHFLNPYKDVKRLVKHLSVEGAIIGCTDFWYGGSLLQHPSNDKSYWKHRTHVTAWSFPSMRYLAKVFDLSVSFFKVDTPGFGAKVFFVFYRGESVATFVENLPKVFHNAF